MQALYWLLAAAAFIFLEIMTMGLTTIWFAGGALIAALTAQIGLPLGLQIVIFVLFSFFLLLITKPLAARFLNNKTERTNVDSLIGQSCLVTKDIDNLKATGEVKIKGQTWSAKSSEEDIRIPVNAVVRVESVTGVKLVVSLVTLPGKVGQDEKNVRRDEIQI